MNNEKYTRCVVLDGTKEDDVFDFKVQPGIYDVTLSSFTSDKSANEKNLIWKNRTGRPNTPAWTPDQMDGLEFWLDASDVSSLVLTGDTVDEWNDKVNAVVGDAPADNRPTYDATANGGMGAVVFDQSGTNKEWLDFGDILQSTNATGLTIMGVFKTPDNGNSMIISKFGTPSGSLNRWRLQATEESTELRRTTFVYGQLITTNSDPFTHEANDLAILSGIYDNGIASNISAIVNGKVGTSPTSVSPDATTHNRNVYLARIEDGDHTNLSACEVLAFLRPLSIFERQVVEGYLSHKWGTPLPDDHPYKNIPPGYIENLRSITYAPSLGLFAVVVITGVGNRIITSPDGITWTTRTNPQDNQFHSITWSEEVGCFVSVSDSGTDRVMRSTDGIIWTTQTITSQAWKEVIWVKQLSKFYAVALNGPSSRVSSSPDGITWTTHTTQNTTSWRSLAYSPTLGSGQGRLVAVGSGSNNERVMYSDNGGTSWTTSDSITINKIWNNVEWSPFLHRFVAVNFNASNTDIAYSDDGITWNIATAPSVIQGFSVFWSDELNIFIIPNRNPIASNIMYSSDGINWSVSGIPLTVTNSVAYGLGKYVVVGDFGAISTSFTGREQRSVRLFLDDINTGDGVQDVLISDTANNNNVSIHYTRSYMSGKIRYKIRTLDGFPINRRFIVTFNLERIV